MGKNVIISVFDKSNLDVIAKFLVNKKFTIYSTGGTSKFLRKINVPHKEITKYTKQKEILGRSCQNTSSKNLWRPLRHECQRS